MEFYTFKWNLNFGTYEKSNAIMPVIVEGSRIYYFPCFTAVRKIQHPDRRLPPLPQLQLNLPEATTRSDHSIGAEGPEKSSQDSIANEVDKSNADMVRTRQISDPIKEELGDLGMVISNSRECV